MCVYVYIERERERERSEQCLAHNKHHLFAIIVVVSLITINYFRASLICVQTNGRSEKAPLRK